MKVKGGRGTVIFLILVTAKDSGDKLLKWIRKFKGGYKGIVVTAPPCSIPTNKGYSSRAWSKRLSHISLKAITSLGYMGYPANNIVEFTQRSFLPPCLQFCHFLL